MRYKEGMRIGTLLALLLTITTPSLAEMYECDGVWKNTPCDAPRMKEPVRQQKKPALEVSSKDILAEPEESNSEPEPEEPVDNLDVQRKQFMVDSLKEMNKTCGNFYNRSHLKKFEQECSRSSATECEAKWSSLHADMLGKAKDDTCRNAIFNATNRLSVLK